MRSNEEARLALDCLKLAVEHAPSHAEPDDVVAAAGKFYAFVIDQPKGDGRAI